MDTNSEHLHKRYKRLFADVSAILFRHDPVLIAFGNNTDEYDPEASTILGRLRECRSEVDVLRAISEEFDRWFGGAAREMGRLRNAAHDIWARWLAENDEPGSTGADLT